jgi:amino acid adenylation domain-containing protein/non-ribosomal peptide synthase protein (TIGR01720 family)
MQRGLLFHSLATDAPDVYARQVAWVFAPPFDVDRYAQAWRLLTSRHAALRTSFVWQDVPEPLQVVHADVPPPVQIIDDLRAESHKWYARFEELVAAERGRRFQLGSPPLFRFTLIPGHDGRCGCILMFHHLILDGWSLAAVLAEALMLYAGAPEGALPRRPSFGEFVTFQTRADRPVDDGFWSKTLAGFARPGESSASRRVRRGADPTTGSRTVGIELTEDQSRVLFQRARALLITPSTLLHFAWAFVLARQAGTHDVVFGTSVSGRAIEFPDIDAVVGVLTHTVPVRVVLDEGSPIGTSVTALHRLIERAATATATPLSAMTAWTALPRGEALFDAMLVVENYPVDRTVNSALRTQITGVRADTATHYALTLTAWLRQPIELRLDADPGSYDAPAAADILAHVVATLEVLAVRPDARIRDLPPIPPMQVQAVITRWPRGAPAAAGDRVDVCVRARAREQPHAVALRSRGSEISYAELDRRVDSVAGALVALGVDYEDLVALALDASPELVVVALAVMRIGAAFLPLDTKEPPARLRAVLENAAPKLVVVDSSRVERGLYASTSRCVDIHQLESEHEPAPHRAVHGLMAAYVIYTSGSTGQPKGVVVPHDALANYVHFAASAYGVSSGDGTPVHSSPAVDLTITSLLMPLIAGGFVEVTGSLLDAEGPACATRYRFLKLTPTHLSACAYVPSAASIVRHASVLVVGGETLTAEAVSPWLDANVEIVNEYGPTEATVGCAIHRITADDLINRGALPIGRAIAGASIYVLGDDLMPRPVGVPGELCIGGVCLARGYVGDSPLTASRFVPDPFGETPGARLYRTGDVAVWRTDGVLELLGRVDTQIKVHGVRIEAEEIENALLRQPGVQQAAVSVHGEGIDRQLIAYLVCEREPDPIALRRQLAAELPDAAIPKRYVRLASLPQTAGGKLARAALPPPVADDARPRSAGQPTSDERALALAWKAVLGVEAPNLDADFFSLGGDSIASLQLVVKAREAGLILTPRQIIEHPTIRAQARVAVRVLDVGSEVAEQEPPGPVLLTPIQRWLLDLHMPDPQHWNQALLLTPRRPVDRERLAWALDRLAEHHGALRLRFAQEHGEWTQMYGAVAPVPLDEVSASGVADIDDAVLPFQRALDLCRGPVFRAVWVRGDRSEHLLLIAHHLVVDGVSWRIIRHDLERLLSAEQPNATCLGPRTASFAAWAAALQQFAESGHARHDRPSWLARVVEPGDPPWQELDGQVDNEASSRSIQTRFDRRATADILDAAGRILACQADELLLAAAVRVLANVAGLGRLRVDVEHHGREIPGTAPDVSRTVGWFTSLYPLSVTSAPEPAHETVRRIRSQLRLVPSGGISFGALRYLAPDSLPEPRQRSTLRFNYMGRFDESGGEHLFDIEAVSLRSSRSTRARRPHPLELDAAVVDGELNLFWTYSQSRHRPATVEKLARRMSEELSEIVALGSAGSELEPVAQFPLTELNASTIAHLARVLADET